MSKKCRDSLGLNYRLRKYVFFENVYVLHSIFSHTLISVSTCMPDTNPSIMLMRWREKRQNSLVWDWWLGHYSRKTDWANTSHSTVNSLPLSSLESIYFRDFTSTVGTPRKCQEIHTLMCFSQDKKRWRVRIASIKWTHFQPELSSAEIYAEKGGILALGFWTESVQSHPWS